MPFRSLGAVEWTQLGDLEGMKQVRNRQNLMSACISKYLWDVCFELLLFWPTVLHRIDKCHHGWNYSLVHRRSRSRRPRNPQCNDHIHYYLSHLMSLFCIILKLISFKLLVNAFKTTSSIEPFKSWELSPKDIKHDPPNICGSISRLYFKVSFKKLKKISSHLYYTLLGSTKYMCFKAHFNIVMLGTRFWGQSFRAATLLTNAWLWKRLADIVTIPCLVCRGSPDISQVEVWKTGEKLNMLGNCCYMTLRGSKNQ